jgi:hypothetical protein
VLCPEFVWPPVDSRLCPPALGSLAVQQQGRDALTAAAGAICCSCRPPSCVTLTDMILCSCCGAFLRPGSCFVGLGCGRVSWPPSYCCAALLAAVARRACLLLLRTDPTVHVPNRYPCRRIAGLDHAGEPGKRWAWTHLLQQFVLPLQNVQRRQRLGLCPHADHPLPLVGTCRRTGQKFGSRTS